MTFEMSNHEEQQRYLSLGAGINLNHILRNGLTASDRDKAQDFWEEISEATDLTFIHDTTSTTTVGGIAAKIEQIPGLEFIIIDGAYLMEDENGEDPGSSRALTNITRSLKRLAQKKKITIILTTQALISRTSKKNGTQLASIGYTSSFAQDSDAIIGLDRDDLTVPTAKLKIIAARNALGVEAELIFDYTQGVIEEADGGFSGTFHSDKTGYADDGN
jgi:replicative DNA helicase